MRRKWHSERRYNRLRERVTRLEERVDELTALARSTEPRKNYQPDSPNGSHLLQPTTDQLNSAIEPLAEIAQRFVPGRFKISAYSDRLYLESRYMPSQEFNRALEAFRTEFSVGVILRPLGFGLPENPIRVLNGHGKPEP